MSPASINCDLDADSSRPEALRILDAAMSDRHGKSTEFFEGLILRNISDVFYWGAALTRRELVESVPKIGKIHVYRDHNPPHFHVILPEHDLMIDFNTCNIIKGGTLSAKQTKDLQKWYFRTGGQRLVCILWNKWNPDNQLEVIGEDTTFSGVSMQRAVSPIIDKSSKEDLKRSDQIEFSAKKDSKGGGK